MGSTYGWGLIGPGRFAREFADELSKNERAKCVGVASRDIARSTSFANEFGFARAYGSYDEIMGDNEVEIIYVVVPHVFHQKIAEMALRAGKSVLCEKPLTTGFEESLSLTSLAREKNVFLMEAMKTGFLPAIQQARKWIREGEIGTPKILKADFCFSGPDFPEDRLMNPDLGGGAVLDVGVYPVYLAQYLFGEVVATRAEGSVTQTGVEDTAAITCRHKNGAVSALTCSFQSRSEAMDAVVLGTKGSIEIPCFHKADRVVLKKVGSADEVFEDKTGGMVNAEIEAVMDSLDRGLTECPGHSHADTLALARVVDEVRNSILGG
ncbi:MAG: Gfo/Idh/MocA family oxidoreductase [Verrucomicrobiales bacterium]|nr:Gfo/Idh/MocA family oxidoreductase [Verrucomicrobiales bacterium]